MLLNRFALKIGIKAEGEGIKKAQFSCLVVNIDHDACCRNFGLEATQIKPANALEKQVLLIILLF